MHRKETNFGKELKESIWGLISAFETKATLKK